MATKPEDINPFAKYIEQPKAEPAPEVNPFAQYVPYTVGTGLGDASKMIAAGAIGPTLAIPQGIESAARNIPRQALEQQGIDVPEKVGPMTFAEELVKKGPAQLFTNIGRAFIKDATGESFEKQQERQKDNEIALDRLISKVPRIPLTESLAKYGEEKSKALTESVSEVGKARIAESQVAGSIIEAIKNRSVENLSFGKDPSVMGYALQGSQVLGSLVPIIGTALLTKSSKAVGTVGFGMGAGEAVQDAQEYVNKLSDAELVKASPYFKTMLEKGVPPQEARKVVTDKAAEYAAQLQGSVSAFGDVITGKLMTGQFDKLMTGPVKNRLGRIAIGGTGGLLEEGTQEFLEGIAKDIGINKTVIKEIGEDSFANFVMGAIGGAGPGAYRGAVAKTVEEQNAPKPPKEDIDAQMRAALTGTGVPPVPPVAADLIRRPVVPPAPPAAPAAEVELAPAMPVPASVVAPVAAMVSTVGLDPETAQRVEGLKTELKIIDGRRTDPTRTPSDDELEFLAESEAEIAKEITSLVSPKAPEVAPPIAQIDEELIGNLQEFGEPITSRMDAESRISNGEQIYAFPEQDEQPLLIRNIDELSAYPPDRLLALPSVAPVAEEVVTEPEVTPAVEEAAAPVAPKGVTPDAKQEPKTYNFGSGNIDARVSQAYSEEQYKNTYGEDGGILSFSFEGPGVDSSTGFKSVAGITYQGKMTPERLEEMMAGIAANNSKPEKTQAEINKERQAAQREAKKAEKPSKEDASEKKMLDAIESVKKVKGSANDFIAKHGKAMFDRARKEGYIDNEANDQRLFSTNKLEELYSKYNEPEEYAAMLKRREEAAKKTVVETPEKEKPTIEVTANTIFTEDAATKARNRLRSKLGQLNSGIDPEFLIDGITLSGYHIEKGARTFAAYAKAMIADLGDKVKPYLKQWYNAVRDDPSAESLVDSMDDYDTVRNANLPDTTDGMMDLMDPEDKFDIAKLLASTMSGPNPNEYKSILEARAFISKLTGKKIEAGTAEAKEADEAIETAIVLAARDIIDLNRKNGNDFRTYDDLVGLYERQPNLSVRTSTSVKEQAYSTPVPLAYVASRLAGITEKTSVYEPTAGNGMLLIAANPKNVIANELNATRYEMLERVMDGATINNQNAVELDITRDFDAIIANPPFGIVKNRSGETISYNVDGLKTNEIDHAIAFKALNNMKEDGRAVLIVGGVLGDSADKRVDGYRSKSKREFYYNLYDKYNVVDHFTVAGDLYKKQGAAYPVDVIVIDGKGKSSRKLPAADLPKVISSYEQLKEKLNEPSLVSKGNVSPTRVDSGAATEGRGEQQGLDRGTVGQGNRPSDAGERPAGVSAEGVSSAGTAPSGRGEPAGNVPSEGQPRSENKPKLPAGEQPVSSEPKRIEPRGAASTEGNKPSTVGGTSQVSSKRVEPGLTDRRGQEQETANQVGYNPHSQAGAVGTLAPSAMAAAIDESLTYLEDQVGDIDNYVASKLDFEVEDLKAKFSAEQVDALALAINNAEQGKGFIIGDQTGVGKGRVVAGMIKYALLQGQIPVFMTQKPNLYSDMIRDLDDIGMTDVLNLDSDTPNILITQADEKIPFALARKDKDGQPYEKKHVLKNPVPQTKHNDFMKQLVRDNDLGKFKVIFSVYDSMNTKDKKLTERAKMVEHFADNNYLILDESHAAGGSGGDPEAVSRAGFIRKLVNNSKGSFFSSATYAKRPDVMDLYSTTDMKLAVDNISELAEAIKRGGVPMQQAVANMLTKSGQYIRRERTFAGVTYETKESKVDKPTAENMATAMRSILNFSDKKKGAVKDLKKELDEIGAMGAERDIKTDIEQANFGSVMHSLIDQMLLSLKTAQSVDFAIERLKAGEKVVMTVANTMGSFMQDYADDNGLVKGEQIDLSFSDLFHKYLDKQRWITIKHPGGRKEKRRLTDAELGPDLVNLYNSVEDFIENAGFGAAPVSPIDYMHNALRKAGYKTDEITGRNLVIDYSGGVPILRGRDSDIAQRVNAVDGFNNGDTNVIILNQAGSTGLSLHASSKFKNQQKRHMLIVQPEKNIDTHMQMLGRVHRTGQVDTPTYSQMMADIPAEMRPAAVLLKKMASLNANTTASRKSSVTAEGVVDFMNDYGGQVVQEYLKDNPEVYEATGKKIKLIDDSTEGTVEDITKFTGYIPILPIAEQEEVYKDITERYNELLERENSMGTNKLEARAMDLGAVTVSSEQITDQKEGNSLFAAPAIMEKVDVKRTVKPYSSQEVREMSEKNLDGKTAASYAGDQIQELATRSRDIQDKKIQKAIEDGVDAVRLDTIKNQIGMQTSKIRTILQTYRIGNQISVIDPNGGFVYGVIVNIATPKASANATAPSNWKMQIALANGDAKSLPISFSQIDSTYKLKEESYDVNWFNPETQNVEYVKVIQIFDKGSTERREKRWMITGNLLAGFAKFPGQIVNYTKTDAEGNALPDGQGILLPRQFDFEKAKEEAPVKIKRAEDVVRFLKEVDYSSVGTQDKVLRIVNRNGLFSFVVPKSKRIGGTFFLDDGLMKALGTQFTQRGSDMIANTWDEGKALAAIDYVINQRQNPIIALNPLKKAREMFQPKVALENFEPAKEFQMSDLDQKAKSYTLPAGTRLFHGAHLTKAEEIKLAKKALSARQKEKSGGGMLYEGNLIWFGDKALAKSHSESAVDVMKAAYDEEETGIKRQAGEVFSTVTDRPYKLINRNYVLSEAEAKKLTKALGLPDYKPMEAGDAAWQAAYRGHTNGENVPKYDVVRSGRMSSPWPIILDTLGYDGYFDETGIAFAAKNAVQLGDEQTPMRIENYVGNVTPTQVEGRREEVRQENIQRLKSLTREIDKNVKLVEAGKVNVQVQRDLVYLREAKKSMQKVITRTKPSRVGAQWVRTKASGDNAAGNLDTDAYKVIENLANKYPNLLDGLQLSVPESKRPGVTGNFNPIEKIVTVYKGSSKQAGTMRHEIAHSMEQMMTPDAQMSVVESWADALSKAIEKNTDKPSQDYFHAVLNFIEKPSIANQKKAQDLMPDYSFYQYINPSEYWAVNAEPLMKAQLGSGWAKFVKAMQKLWESIKSVLGFDNRYAVHKEFARIMSGDQQRITDKMLVEYVTDNADSLKFLNNVEDFDKQFAEDGFNKTPIKPSSTVKDTLLGGIKQGKQAYQNTVDAPAMAYKAMSGKLLRGITYVRNKNVWFGAGLEVAERFTQKAQGLAGKLRDGEGRAMASIAITNALHAGHVASEVIMRGALAFNGKTQMFQAIRRPFSMANIMMEKHNLMDRVGAQRAADMIQMFFEAKRSASIMKEYKELEKEVARLDAERLAPGLSDEKLNDILNDLLDAKQSLRQVGIAKKKVRMTEQQIQFYGDLEKANPELRKMLDNWTKVNENMIDMMLFGKIISKKRAERLKGIKDYVPWYRVQDDMEDVHDQTSMGGVRSNTNIAKEKKFKDTEVDMDIDDIVDNMLHNVMVITRNSMRNYAANRVTDAYATRIKGRIAVYPKEGATKDGAVRLNILRNGRRVIVEIKDPLVAESVTGMEEIAMPAMEMLGMVANGLRRGITLWPEFQVRQLFMDAPTAALVSGVKNPTKLWGETFAAFARAAVSNDPVVDMLKSYGIGGYQSYNRTPEQEYKQQIGLIEKNKFDWLMSKLDKIGDASDYGQRVAIYNRVLAETGDEMMALTQANNVIDFLKRGSGRTAQFLTRTVAFMNAYAQQIDVLAMTLMGSGYTGKDRARALAQLGKTAALFSFYVMMYSWAVGGHDDYEELDDQTKLRNIVIPKALMQNIGINETLLIPMHTSASFFFKSIPEMVYNKVTKEGTVNEIDNTRLRHALAEAALDSLLGPNPVPTGVKPLAEIGLNRSFFTGRALTPKTLEGIDAAEQYNASTSELGKIISAITGLPFQAAEAITGFKVGDKRVINPIEADHLVRSLFGSTGAAVQWGTNLFSGDRPTPREKDNPFYGSFLAADVGRAPEDLFYSFKDKVDSRYKTYQSLLKDAKFEQADKYFDRYENEISAHKYIAAMDSDLAKINREIRGLGRANRDMTPDQRRAEITEMQRLKNQILDDVIAMRKEAGL
jgi:hypothetical protein